MSESRALARTVYRGLSALTRAAAAGGPFEPLAWRLIPRLQAASAKSLGGDDFLCSYDGDVRIYVDLNDHIELQIFWQGFQAADRGEMLLLGRLLQRDSVLVDVGANVGVFTLYGAKRVPNGAVHSFEPSRHHLGRLKRNIAANGFANVTVNDVGLSDRAAERTLAIPPRGDGLHNTGGASFFGVGADSGTEEVRTVRLDDYVAERNLARLDAMKIDVEGAEFEVLRGAEETLRRFRPTVLMEVSIGRLGQVGMTMADAVGFWSERGYAARSIIADGAIGPPVDTALPRALQNICCIPDESDLLKLA